MSQVLERLQLIMEANTANYVSQIRNARSQSSRDFTNIQENVAKMQRKVTQSFVNIGREAVAGLGAFASVAGALSFARTADSMQDMHAQIKLVTASTEQYQAVQESLHALSQKNYADIEATTGLYTNSARALENLGKTQQEVLKFTDAVSLAMGVGGKSATEQASALLQLGQAMQSGVLKGDEFRSLGENAPIILDLIAQKLGVTRGALRDLSKEGEITSQVIYESMVGATDKLQSMFDSMPVTMGQAFTQVKNEYKQFTHEVMNDTNGIASHIATTLSWVANNFDNLVNVAKAGVGVAGVLAFKSLASSAMSAIAPIVANTQAVLINASSQQRLGNVILAVVQGHTPLQMAIRRYTVATTTAISSTVAFARALPAKIANINRSTTSIIANIRATLSLANAQKAIISTTILAGRGILGVGTALGRVGAMINAHPLMIIGGVLLTVIAHTEGLQGAFESFGDAVNVVGSIFGEFVVTAVKGIGSVLGTAVDFFGSFISGSKDSTQTSQGYFSDLFSDTEKGFVGVLQVCARVFDLAGATIRGFVVTGINAIKNLVIGASNALSWLKSQFGFGDGSQQAYENLSLTGNIAKSVDIVSSSGLESLVNTHNQIVNTKKATDKATLALGGMGTAFDKVGGSADKAGGKGKSATNKIKKGADEAKKALEKLKDEFKSLQNSLLTDRDKAIHEATEKIDLLKKAFENRLINATENKTLQDKVQENLDERLAEITHAHQQELDEYLQFYKTKEEMINRHYSYLAEKVQYSTKFNDEEKEFATGILAIKKQNEQLEYQLSILERLQDIDDYKMSEADLIGNKYALMASRIDMEFKTSDPARHQAFMKAIEERRDYELEQHRIIQEKQISDMLDFQKTDLQRIADKYAFERQEIERNLKLTEDERLKRLDIINQQQVFDTQKLQKTQRDEFLTQQAGFMGANEYLELENSLATQKENLDKWRANEAISDDEWKAGRLQAEKNYLQAKNALTLSYGEQMAGNMAGVLKNIAGENSRAYRAMFAIEKGFAIAKSIMAIQATIASSGMSLPFPANLGAMATIATQMGSIVANIQAVRMPIGQAHDGIMSVPKSGTWNLEKGERVLPKHTAKALDDRLDNFDKKGNTPNIIINNYTGEKAEVSQQPNGDLLVVIGQVVDAKIAKNNRDQLRQGGINYGR